MTTNDDKSLPILNELMLVARDSERGFQLAADLVKVPDLVELFAGYVLQRAKFVKEIEARIKTLRGTPKQLPSPGAALHREWMGLKAALESNEAHAILAECERGEDMSVKAYVAALKNVDLDRISHDMVQRQYELVQAAHDKVRQLRDSATYAHR